MNCKCAQLQLDMVKVDTIFVCNVVVVRTGD